MVAKKGSFSISPSSASLLFILGFGTFIFTRLSKLVPTIPVSILISFIFILRFSRTQPKKKTWLTLIGFILAMNIGLLGLFDIGSSTSYLIFNLARSSLLAVLYFLPFLVDRFIYPKFKENKYLSILIFPTIVTAIFFLSTLEGPFEGNIQPGKFVFGTLALKQILSLFGVFGFVHFTSWIVSIVNYLWEEKFNFKRKKKLILTSLLVVILIYAFGFIKIYTSPQSETVKVASIIITPSWKDISLQEIYDKKITSPIGESLTKIESEIKSAVSNGANIISFQETLMIVDEKSVEEVRSEYQRLAKENNVYLSITYAYLAEEGKGENKHLLIDNDGKILIDYTKRYLVGIGDLVESGVFIKGPEIIQYADTPYGRIAATTCRDIEMDKYVIQAGKANVDIMFTPSYDWPESWVLGNTQSAIANGLSLVRTTYNGITYAEDYNGKILNQMDYKNTAGIMYVDVPIKGVNTLYPKVGKLIGYLSTVGLIALIVVAIKKSKTK